MALRRIADILEARSNRCTLRDTFRTLRGSHRRLELETQRRRCTSGPGPNRGHDGASGVQNDRIR